MTGMRKIILVIPFLQEVDLSREPLITIGTIMAVVGSLIALLRAFGVPITNEQQDAMNQFLIAAGPLVVALVARRYVTPLSSPRDANGVELTRPDGTQAATKKS